MNVQMVIIYFAMCMEEFYNTDCAEQCVYEAFASLVDEETITKALEDGKILGVLKQLASCYIL